MTRAVIYARYSSDLQTDASIEDQIRVTSERAKREGWEVTNHYTDHGISGASMIRRPSLQKMMQDAADRKFDVVIAEALDRLSRDQEDIAGIYKRLAFAGVKVITLSEGEINEMHIGLKGTMNALFLKDLAAKTHRGQRGRIENGKSGGGNSYGYDIVKKFDANGEPVRGDRTINQDQAKIVNRIFREYVAGKSPKAIAKQLNKESIAGPSTSGWMQSTINGNRKRGTGILNNELYIGQLIWNRLSYVKEPDTGKRISRLNPESAWIKKEVPEMRLVDQELWDKVKERQAALDHKVNLCSKQRPKLLFSGILKCGCCGSGFTKISKHHYGCFAARDKGTCNNMESIRQDVVEGSVLTALQHHLMDPKLCDIFCDEYAKYMAEMRRVHNNSLADYKAELKRCQKEDMKMVQAICDGFASPQLKDKMNANTARMEVLQGLLIEKEEVPLLLEPVMAKHYRKEVKALIASLNSPEHRSEAAEMIRSLVEKIVFTPKENGHGLDMDLHGSLAGILTIAAGNTKTKSEKQELIQQVVSVAEGCDRYTDEVQDILVAGAGFEPAAFRL
ncbi:MAG: recombinase family protein [Alphaproteobacteria bacterium]|nr:recombinase family protein [Alphaproteobacteria bacterium]